MRNICSTLIGKPDGNKPFGKHTLGWEDNIKMFQRNRT
jgi:hypothetical protein